MMMIVLNVIETATGHVTMIVLNVIEATDHVNNKSSPRDCKVSQAAYPM